MTSPILEKIRSADNLPSLPAVAVQVLKMARADDVSLADVARVIQQDPAITFKVLKVVNSSLFGVPRKVSSVQQAVVVLGLRTVKVMVLSFSLVDTFKDRQTGDFDYATYWRPVADRGRNRQNSGRTHLRADRGRSLRRRPALRSRHAGRFPLCQ